MCASSADGGEVWKTLEVSARFWYWNDCRLRGFNCFRLHLFVSWNVHIKNTFTVQISFKNTSTDRMLPECGCFTLQVLVVFG